MSRKLVICLFALTVFCASAQAGPESRHNRGNSLLDKPAPPIQLNDVNGKPFDLAALKGKVVLLNFWASW